MKYKGIHPGLIILRELKKRSIRQRPFAQAVSEHPQTFNAITQGKRKLNTALALKIEKELNLEEGTLVILQSLYDIRIEKEKQKILTPDMSVLRISLFWDTDLNQIDWERQYKAVIKRVFEKGNEEEKKEITRFYGKAKVRAVVGLQTTQPAILRPKNL